MKILRKAFGATAEAVEGARQVVVTCSTATVDRVGDVMVQAGIDVANFARLKTVLWNHDQDRPIAKAVEVAIAGDALRAVVEFPPEGVSALADEIYGLIKAGVINAVSIGFRPITCEPRDGVNPKKGVVVTQSELLELSFVSVPANPQAEIMERAMPATTKGAPRVAVKSLWDLGTLVAVVQMLGGMAQDAAWEAEYEGDGSEMPARLAEACRAAGAILVDMTAEEVGEFLARVAPEAGDTEEKRLPHLVVKAAVGAARAGADPLRYVAYSPKALSSEAVTRLKGAIEAWQKNGGILMLDAGIELERHDARGVAAIEKGGRKFSASSKGTLTDACKAIQDAHDAIKAMVDEAEPEAAAGEEGKAAPVPATKATPAPATKSDGQDRRRRLTRLLSAA